MMKKAIYLILLAFVIGNHAYAQSPEISLREFASGQIKKGVRSIGMGQPGVIMLWYGEIRQPRCWMLATHGTPTVTILDLTRLGLPRHLYGTE